MQFADDIPTFLVKLPRTITGLTTVDENGNPMIFLNERLTGAQQLRIYEHEYRHIQRDDFYNELFITSAEADEYMD